MPYILLYEDPADDDTTDVTQSNPWQGLFIKMGRKFDRNCTIDRNGKQEMYNVRDLSNLQGGTRIVLITQD